MLLGVLIQVIDALFLQALPIDDKEKVSWAWVFPTVIWVVYMLRSRRVRNTFVN